MTISISPISFDVILPLWHQLWPVRQSKIEETSWMLFKGGYCKELPPPAIFFGLFLNDQLIGCNSVHAVEDSSVRSRGLFVLPKHRKVGYGEYVLKHSRDYFLDEYPSRTLVWSFARSTSVQTYLRCGFRIEGDEVVNDDIQETNYWVIMP